MSTYIAQKVNASKFDSLILSFMRFSDWEAKTHRAGRASGDLSFPVVYCPELHYPEFYSAVADMKVTFSVFFLQITKF